MAIHIPRHDLPVSDFDKAVAPIAQSVDEVLSGLETSEFDRFDALDYTLTLAKWACLTELLQRCSSSVRTALAIDVMRLGLHRDLRKIRQNRMAVHLLDDPKPRTVGEVPST